MCIFGEMMKPAEMIKKEKFVSQALEANLAETRYKNIVIPPEHQQFIELSKDYYGISKRASDCFIEFQHPFSNRKFVVEQLREMMLTDFWFYTTLPEAEKAYLVILSVYDTLFTKGISEDLQVLAIRTLFEFIDKLTAEKKELTQTGLLTLEILQKHFSANIDSFIKSSRFVLRFLKKAVKIPVFTEPILQLTRNILQSNVEFWKHSTETEQWYKNKKQLFSKDYTNEIAGIGAPFFDEKIQKLQQAGNWDALTETDATYDDMASHFIDYTSHFETFTDKFYYTFYLLHLPGMVEMKERLIWNIGRLLDKAMDELKPGEIESFTEKMFHMAEDLRGEHTSAVLDFLLVLGKKNIDLDPTEDKHLVNEFEKRLIDFGFETPGIVYVNEDWQLSVNPNHIKNIRVWLELIEYSQAMMEKLLSALIVNLRLGGIFISDTDLFQREITKILNSNIAPYYKKVKQLTRIFPVYFNEIGAEGGIRNVTTSMDEISKREDRLVHFLRKQVHTESNNTLIELTRNVFYFWYDGNLEALKPHLPNDVYESIDLQSEWFLPVHRMLAEMCKQNNCTPDDLLNLDYPDFKSYLEKLPEKNDRDVLRLNDIRNLYFLLKEKYSFDTEDIISIMNQYPFLSPEEIGKFDQALSTNHYDRAMRMIYHFMDKLKQIIFNPKLSEGWENIYHKRHIAIGIPSMYGVYREDKFEALGLTFRLERIATRLMEKIVNNVNLNYISQKTLNRIYELLEYFREGLELDGISSQGFDSNLQMLRYSLTSQSFSLDQYLNIFQFIADDVSKIVKKYFLSSYEYPLKIVVPQLFVKDENISEKETKQLIHKKSEEFFRDVISSAFLVQPLDNLVQKILHSLQNMVDKLDKDLINDVMSYNSDLIISPLYERTVKMDNQIFLGSKAFFLKKLLLAGLPVPLGFILTTEVFRRRNAISHHPEVNREIETLIDKEVEALERLCGCRLGDPQRPLLLSVRSGAAISMPGAMDTYLNVGMNDTFTELLSRQPNFGWTAWDCYRRFLQSWGMAHGIARDVFDKIILEYKKKYDVALKIKFTHEQMRDIALSYKKAIDDNHVFFEQNLLKQLKYAIDKVFDSWGSERAQVYRRHLQFADEWGTAVIVQKMILGNLNYTSGTGVLFTQNPNRDRPGVHLWGDFTLCSQGEDIVAGLVNTLPVSETQRKQLNMEGDSLQSMHPEIYQRMKQLSVDMIENHGYPPQEIEFTFESEDPKDLYILQTRDIHMQRQTQVYMFTTRTEEMHHVGRGTGIGGGAMNGLLAFDEQDIDSLHAYNPGKNVILVRPDTVPDDIGMVFKCDGLLTAKGGATSHAAVTAVTLGKACVVNCTDLRVFENLKQCEINGHHFITGDMIAIDGHFGNIYKGNYPVELSEVKAGI
ncbi:MAG: PEP-utilizing enzyme [Lentimicrobiaceae bacterium]|nr:PEP-utilizing enzyme [Lentimicrobiaceae bacterium]